MDIPPRVRELIDEYIVQDVLGASDVIARELINNATFAGGLADALGFEFPEVGGNLKEAIEKYSMLELLLGGSRRQKVLEEALRRSMILENSWMRLGIKSVSLKKMAS